MTMHVCVMIYVYSGNSTVNVPLSLLLLKLLHADKGKAVCRTGACGDHTIDVPGLIVLLQMTSY